MNKEWGEKRGQKMEINRNRKSKGEEERGVGKVKGRIRAEEENERR